MVEPGIRFLAGPVTGKSMVTKAGEGSPSRTGTWEIPHPFFGKGRSGSSLWGKGEEMGMPKLLLSRTWRSSLFPATCTPTPYSDLWRLEVQREKLRSAGHWGEESRSGVVGVGGGGNDMSPLPAAGASGPPEERERSLSGGTLHKVCIPLPTPTHGLRPT